MFMIMETKETSVMDELRDLTVCSICNNMISDPRGLPCIHTFCLECLENFELSLHKKPGEKMLCPVCRKEFSIPSEGMNGLQKNFFVERLAELIKISKPIGNVTGCDACKVSNCSAEMETEASEYCIQCREKLCSRCSMEHMRNKFSRSHQVVQMGCDVTEFLAENHYSSVCDLHPEEKTKMYCIQCKVVICMMCFAESHNTHKCMDIKKAGEKFQKEIESDIEKLLDFPSETMVRKEQLEQEKKKFMKELQEAERTIKSYCKKLKDTAEKHTNDLLDELSAVEQKRFKVMDSRKEEVERHLESVDRFITYSKEITSRGSAGEICRAVNDLHMRAKELQKLHNIHIRQSSSSASVSFRQMEYLYLFANILGKIEEKEETEEKSGILGIIRRQTVATWSAILLSILVIVGLCYDPDRKVSPATRLYAPCDNVLSIAFSQTALNILCNDPRRLFIYEDQSPFNLRASLLLDWMIEPDTLVASPSSDSLYLADSGNDCIWIISREGSQYMKTKWMCNDDLRLKSLSADGSTILATNQYFWKLQLYNSEYTHLLNSFDLPTDVYSQSAVKTSTGDFVVSCRSRIGYIKSICKFRKTGSLVHCHMLTGLSEPDLHIHLALTSDDRVLVADTWNNRILLLNSDLSWNRVLLTGVSDPNIIKPTLLCYKKERKLLAVVNFHGSILVYDSVAIGLQ